ncbi:ATP-dependent DNA ligase [Allosaccharopolyspora coralli]|uniref:DNA ligase (ATP) n=2 Tax=Allosaccharopolyspora coralli TaxID=2665642 RepID=A0A5Q3QNH9_9PSEU|nr:ATP-dependent DNA ligase [Allosaccharopolyspora coralli]
MLATLTERRFSDPGWIFEPKLDGVRALAMRDGGRAELWSRNQKSLDASYPEIIAALQAQESPRFVVDGELVAFDGDRTSFAMLQQRMQLTDTDRIEATGVPVYFYVFDLLFHDGDEVSALPLRRRKRLLGDVLDFTDPIRLSTHRNTDGEAYYEYACAHRWEGLIAKRADGRYHGGRSRDWLKFKCVRDQEFVVGGYTDPEGSRNGFGALLVGYFHEGALRYAGKVGTGYDERTLRSLRSRLDALGRSSSPFAERVRARGTHWVEPELVVEIGFTEWTTDGKLRHPRYTGVREDKKAADVVRETR